ncbi:PKD domain-containing protein [Natrarchaeobius oligotrophus]|uniref:PKD domain-containing protein n=1 Tax=Natrarchaeobius chitinivorans TaxID=1679083 RepID=A0A3N6MYD1_NATCH|nr:PKD domain-containing protein [Natrarchaeobius chitinivorans]RQH00087.1 PKD domain-containing protein [Natrarchaeobius chitinivorans]
MSNTTRDLTETMYSTAPEQANTRATTRPNSATDAVSATTRRRSLQLATATILGGLATGAVSGTAAAASITFVDPPASGTDRVAVEVRPGDSLADEDLRIRVFGPDGSEITESPGMLAANESTTLSLSLERSLESDENVLVALLPTGGYDRSAATSEAYATAERGVKDLETFNGVETTLVEADPDAGFDYPYLLYAPSIVDPEADRPILVEPANSGTADDDMAVHEEAGRDLVSFQNELADRIEVPFVVPVFPRPATEPVDWSHYTHALDDTTLALSDTPLERIDEQVLRMVEDAQERLVEGDYPVRTGENDLLLNGFSASGNFVDRFTFLHPKRVNSVTAGGLNGMALLPVEEVDGETLPYHVGIADVAGLTGDPVDLEAVDDVDQFLYMGADDQNDTIPYDDAWTDDDLRQTALSIYGDDMIDERFVRSQELYRKAGIDAAFRVYEDVGHEVPPHVRDDIVAFHHRSIDGEKPGELGENLVPDPSISVSPSDPAPSETVEFDSGNTDPGRGTVIAHEWTFEDGESAAGETATRTFDEAGEHVVELTITTDAGKQHTADRTLTVSQSDSGSSSEEVDVPDETDDAPPEASTETSPMKSETPTEGSQTTDTTTEEPTETYPSTPGGIGVNVPPFGVPVAVATVLGGALAIKRKIGTGRDRDAE